MSRAGHVRVIAVEVTLEQVTAVMLIGVFIVVMVRAFEAVPDPIELVAQI